MIVGCGKGDKLVKVDRGLGSELQTIPDVARAAERMGFDGLWSAEARHDAMLPLVLAAEHTERVELGTGIVVAFARSPLHFAHVGHDLQAYSKGRFILGLGTQVQAHVERRWGATWSHPAARMRELIMALHAIWDCWYDGKRLDFRGDFYQHTLMIPYFTPGSNPYGRPKVFLAAVGERMTEVAGEVSDGVIAHGFTTERYLREVTVPSLERGLAKAGRARSDVEISYRVFVVTGTNEEEMAEAERSVKEQIAFYASTPPYRPVLARHGWADLQTELEQLSKEGRWRDMGGLIDPQILDAFAVKGLPEEIPGLIMARYGDVIDRCTPYSPSIKTQLDRWAPLVQGFQRLRDQGGLRPR